MSSKHGNDAVDLAAVWDEHMRCEFELRDAEATLRTMTDDPCLIEVPVGTGARGHAEVLAFYRDHFIPSWPDDVAVTPLSRTVGVDLLIDEFVVTFTHTKAMDWWLPAVPPTGRQVKLPHVVVIGFQGGKVAYEHVYWDHASLLVQLGLIDPARVPALGVSQAQTLLESRPSLEFTRWRPHTQPGAG